MIFPGNTDRSLISNLLRSIKVALKFDINISSPKQGYHSLHCSFNFFVTATLQSGCQWAFFATSQANQTLRVTLDLAQSGAPFAFRCFTQFVLGNKPAKILVTDSV